MTSAGKQNNPLANSMYDVTRDEVIKLVCLWLESSPFQTLFSILIPKLPSLSGAQCKPLTSLCSGLFIFKSILLKQSCYCLKVVFQGVVRSDDTRPRIAGAIYSECWLDDIHSTWEWLVTFTKSQSTRDRLSNRFMLFQDKPRVFLFLRIQKKCHLYQKVQQDQV